MVRYLYNITHTGFSFTNSVFNTIWDTISRENMSEETHRGEQNRLIIEFMSLVKPIAASYRGSKGIPFEDITAEGMVGLVKAARTWRPDAKIFNLCHALHNEFIR